MSSFVNVGGIARALRRGQAPAPGMFRKTYAATTVAGAWMDCSGFPGIPVPNYYASDPLAFAALNPIRGVLHGPSVSPLKKILRELGMISVTAGFVGTFRLLDYVGYYPFVDLDDASVQTLDNTLALSRYVDGEGLEAMLVAQAPTVGGGSFTFDYVDSDDVAHTSGVCSFNTSAAVIGQIVTSQAGGAAGFGPFLQQRAGSRGIKRVTSFTPLVPGGGLAALVLVKPLATLLVQEAGTYSEVNTLMHQGGDLPIIEDGAYLNYIAQSLGATATNTIVGQIKTVWG